MTAKEREAFEALREAAHVILRDVEHNAAKRGTYDGDQKISGYAWLQTRAALAKAEALEVTHE